MNLIQLLQKLAPMIPFNVLDQASIVSIHPLEPQILLWILVLIGKIKIQDVYLKETSPVWIGPKKYHVSRPRRFG